ncbi:MAG: AI-2E family transporter [Clostridia bacterium]|nr:AI-2E family transporter [Clostridia bacterium]
MKLTWKTCLKVGLSIFVLYLCIHYWPAVSGLMAAALGAAMPLLVGCVVAYIVNILMSLYEKHYFPKTQKTWLIRSRRPVCLTLAFVSVAAIATLVVWLVLPQLIDCVAVIIAETPGVIKAFLDYLARWDILPEDILAALAAIDWQSKIGELAGVLTSGLGSVMDILVKTVSTVFSGVLTALLSVMFSIYLLSSKETLGRQCTRVLSHFLPRKWFEKLRYVLDILNENFHRYIVGQCVEAVILGLLCTAGMFILRLPYAAMVGALMAFTALIPVAGAYIGAGVGAFMILTVSPVKALIFLIFIMILQQLENNLIYPRVVGSSMGLPGIWVLAAVTVGGGIMGVAGMLISVPLAATLYRLVQNEVNKPKIAEE